MASSEDRQAVEEDRRRRRAEDEARQQRALKLLVEEHLPAADVAERTGVSVTTVKRLRSQARKDSAGSAGLPLKVAQDKTRVGRRRVPAPAACFPVDDVEG